MSRLARISFAAIALALAMALPAAAQPNAHRGQGGPGMQKITSKGTLVSASGNQMQMSTSTNQTIMVMIPQGAQVSVTGTAEQDYLKPGVCVEFVAEVAKGGTVKDKIDHLTIITPTTDKPVGLSSPEFGASKKDKGDKGDKDKAKAGHDPGVAEPAPAKGHNTKAKKDDSLNDDLTGGKPSKGSSGATQFPGTFTVRGTIKMCKNGQITVTAGHGPTVKGELSGDATIDVDVSDIRTAQRDDSVSVSGMTSQQRPNLIMAESVTVELANPLSGKKHAAAKTPKTPPAHGKAAAKKDAGGDDPLGGK